LASLVVEEEGLEQGEAVEEVDLELGNLPLEQGPTEGKEVNEVDSAVVVVSVEIGVAEVDSVTGQEEGVAVDEVDSEIEKEEVVVDEASSVPTEMAEEDIKGKIENVISQAHPVPVEAEVPRGSSEQSPPPRLSHEYHPILLYQPSIHKL
jgi:hypothetical protein